MKDYEVKVRVMVSRRGDFSEILESTVEVEVEAPNAVEAALEGLRQAPGDIQVELGYHPGRGGYGSRD